MIKFSFNLMAVTFFTLWTSFTYGQGCSDAGFCTINSFKPNTTDSSRVADNQLKTGAFFGLADNSISVYGNYLEYYRQISGKLGLDVKLTSLGQQGNGISTFGLSDIFVNANYKLSERFKLTVGTKIPLSQANKKVNNLALPMDYQASLGTTDLVFGLGFEIKKMQLVAAVQQPLTQNNNAFLSADYPVNSELSKFQSTQQFGRSGDILLRVSYPLNISHKLTLTPSILPIYHLTNDKFTDEFNEIKEIQGSQGLTLNGNAYLDYELNSKSIIQLNVGVPFIVRDSRPDGLTRSFIANLEYRVKF
jgi:hypothetical protein